MDTVSLFEKLSEILPPHKVYDSHVDIKREDDNYRILYGYMYQTPEIGLNEGLQLKELFDCEDVRLNEFDYQGCETCDLGSDYGHEILIVNPRLNYDIPYNYIKVYKTS